LHSKNNNIRLYKIKQMYARYGTSNASVGRTQWLGTSQRHIARFVTMERKAAKQSAHPTTRQ